jgi:hypothetical protein
MVVGTTCTSHQVGIKARCNKARAWSTRAMRFMSSESALPAMKVRVTLVTRRVSGFKAKRGTSVARGGAWGSPRPPAGMCIRYWCRGAAGVTEQGLGRSHLIRRSHLVAPDVRQGRQCLPRGIRSVGDGSLGGSGGRSWRSGPEGPRGMGLRTNRECREQQRAQTTEDRRETVRKSSCMLTCMGARMPLDSAQVASAQASPIQAKSDRST